MQVEEKFIWEKNARKPGEFRYSMTINIPLVAWPIKMQDLHWSTSWVIPGYAIIHGLHVTSS